MRGRPAHKPDAMKRRFVETLAGAAVPQAEVAAALGVTVPTLRKHYRLEIQRGGALVEAKLVSNLLRLASGSDGVAVRAIAFALRARFGWSEHAPPRG
ncbi:hypothetical protein [Rhizobium giardinii]|uniref:Transcription initiation factor TFIIIB Brf1 subunit/transcription initiation factor TFIIB n=1 Tax=Rhizobium giardinii TaxID=56731 RepID=A0A7W8U971_9HYPH|nr:hypothetical protein [Rhizobium giardinii]MBB5535048.1 transcription initiation factor TFIIIB Brf1 subunit/transcription initiation factor TFIIB [Rhizobium giardinii]